MAKNYKHAGEVAQVTVSADVSSGDPVAFEDRVGVALTDIASGQTGSVQVCGVWTLPKVASGAIPQGKTVYLTPGGSITATASGNKKAGYADVSAADGETVISVALSS